MHNKVLRSKNELTAEKVQLLEQISWWSWSERFEDRWTQRLNAVCKLNACPKSGTKEYDWVRTQRRLYDAGRLPSWKINMCEKIKWWKWTSNASNWYSMFGKVKSLSEDPTAGTSEYEWVKHQRKKYQKGNLSRKRIHALEAIPWWRWKNASDSTWNKHWNEVKVLKSAPRSRHQKYQWFRKQIKNYKLGKLSSERTELCEKIPWWSWE